MGRYVLRRLAIAIPVLLGVTIINFALLSAAPGSAIDALVDPLAGPEVRRALEARLGLDQPFHIQYLAWLQQLLQGNLGYSYADFRPVAVKIGERILPTAALVGTAFVLAYAAGIALGVISALRPYSRLDFFATFAGILGVSVPGFFLGLSAIYLFSLKLPIFPTGGMLTTGADFTIPDLLAHLVLPVAALMLFDMASLVRYTRASMLEVMDLDYVRTASSKGLPHRLVVIRHALRNALNPIITLIGLSLPRLFGGAVVIESVFQWPGMGRLAIDSILGRDYPTLMGLNLIIALLVVLGSLLADLLYSVADPRVRYA
ncbi:MAG: ABC transporter permease [Candidatus Limnocylindria bacterium]